MCSLTSTTRWLNTLPTAFGAATREKIEAVIVASSRLMTLNRTRILASRPSEPFAARGRLGSMGGGGRLLSYGPDLEAVTPTWRPDHAHRSPSAQREWRSFKRRHQSCGHLR